MSRYICIGIMYQVRVMNNESWTRDAFYPVFPKNLFDYSLFEEQGLIRLHPETPAVEISELRTLIHTICGVIGEEPQRSSKDEHDLRARICQANLDGMIELAEKKQYRTFQKDSFPCSTMMNGRKAMLTIDSFIVHLSPYKFYPTNGIAIHEINRKLERLLKESLGTNKYKSLVNSHITL